MGRILLVPMTFRQLPEFFPKAGVLPPDASKQGAVSAPKGLVRHSSQGQRLAGSAATAAIRLTTAAAVTAAVTAAPYGGKGKRQQITRKRIKHRSSSARKAIRF